jgi:hypothetical protein
MYVIGLRRNKLNNTMKIYIVSCRERSSETYSLHQLCSYINALKKEAYMYYDPNEKGDFQNVYPFLSRIKVHPHDTVHDVEENLILVTDVADIRKYRQTFKKIRIAIWWLSTSVSDLYDLFQRISEEKVIHLLPTYYSYITIRPLLPSHSKVFFLGDNIHDSFIVEHKTPLAQERGNCVAYYGHRDIITENICIMNQIPCINIQHLSMEERKEVYRSCKVFANFRYHTGKDIFCREAALSGCVVLSHKCGASGFKEDVDIEEKVVYDHEIPTLMWDIFKDFQKYYEKQEEYRTVIRKEKTEAIIKTELFLENIGSDKN